MVTFNRMLRQLKKETRKIEEKLRTAQKAGNGHEVHACEDYLEFLRWRGDKLTKNMPEPNVLR